MTWMKYAELENLLGDDARARAIFQIAVQQPMLDMPEVLWKAYIDFEIEQGENERVRILYESLLRRTQHIKVWISWLEWETSNEEFDKARALYKRANQALEGSPAEERLLLLEQWKQFEQQHGTEEEQKFVEKMIPKRVKKRRQIIAVDGTDAGWEEYFDYIFPQDQASKINFKLLEAARAWREKQALAMQPEPHEREDEEMEES
nr:unnamed protein product [Meloidogyne enterolobii]